MIFMRIDRVTAIGVWKCGFGGQDRSTKRKKIHDRDAEKVLIQRDRGSGASNEPISRPEASTNEPCGRTPLLRSLRRLRPQIFVRDGGGELDVIDVRQRAKPGEDVGELF